jgi:hypothetical protein
MSELDPLLCTALTNRWALPLSTPFRSLGEVLLLSEVAANCCGSPLVPCILGRNCSPNGQWDKLLVRATARSALFILLTLRSPPSQHPLKVTPKFALFELLRDD